MSKKLESIINARLVEANVLNILPSPELIVAEDALIVTQKSLQLSAEIVAAIDAANSAFRTSEVGEILAKEAMQMTPDEIMHLLPKVTCIPEILQLAKLSVRPDVFVSDTLGDGTIVKELINDYVPRSMLIQFCATAEVVGIGGTVYTGFALDLADLNTASLYIGGSLGLGVGVLTAAGQGLGLTSNSYSSVTGTCVGVDAAGAYAVGGLIDVSIGISAPYIPVMTHINPSSWTLVGYFLEGIGAGVEAYGGFTLKLIDETMPSMYQAPAAHSVDIYSIECIKRQDTSDHDEIHIQVTTDGEPGEEFRYPLWDHYSIAEGETWNVGFTVNFNSSFTISLYESDDPIHSWTVTSDSIASQGNSKILNYSQSGWDKNDIDYNVSVYTPPVV